MENQPFRVNDAIRGHLQFQSAGCGNRHLVVRKGRCYACNRHVFSHECQGDYTKPCGDLATDSPDERGYIPEQNCYRNLKASEHGYKGRDIVACAACANDGAHYRLMISRAIATKQWIPVDEVTL